jgi:putative tricarboxylic transport membrane protein
MQLIQGFMAVVQPATLLLIVAGVVAGIVFGAIPGLSAFTALALFLPITFNMQPINGIAFLISIYVGGLSGGLISAILLGIPGTPSSIATCFDGYPMAQKGEAGKALGIAIIFSFVGGIFGALMLVYLGPVIAGMALRFGPYEYFAVILFALTTVSGLSAGNMKKGLLSCVLGIALSFVGIDRLSSYTRYTGGISNLAAGFNLVPLLIGTFAVSQIIEIAAKGPSDIKHSTSVKVKGVGISFKEFVYQLRNAIPAAFIGLAIGILPGIGGNASNLLAYAFCKKRSKYPEKFGTGVADGIVASETANNATIGGALIVLLTLGIPGDNATSMVLAGFQIHSITPGPLLFKTSADLVYALLAAFIIANIVMMISELLGLPILAKVLCVPGFYLLPIVIACCFVGSFAANNRIFDILVMVIFGLVGYLLKRCDYPLAPMVVGFILAPLLEENVRRSLMRTEGKIMPILSSPIALIFFMLTVVMVVLSVHSEIKEKQKKMQVS